ncbi:hypothetical protein Tco_1337014 [Tanacetum coccineum]
MWDRREIVIVALVMKWLGDMMNEVDIENLTIEQYLMLTQKNQTQGMVRTKSSRVITKDQPPLKERKDPNDYHLFTPNSHYETKEVSSDEDVHEWLNEEFSKHMIGQDKEEEEDALIDILKIVVEECKSIYKKTQIQTPSSRTSEIHRVSFTAKEEQERGKFIKLTMQATV